MKTPQQILQEAREEFEKKFTKTSMWQLVPNTPRKIMAEDKDVAIMMAEISNWHTSTLQSFIEAEIERLANKISSLCGCEVPSPVMNRCKNCLKVIEDKRTANQVLQDQILPLKELLVTLKR